MARHVRHNVDSNLQRTPGRSTYREKKYVIETAEFRITRAVEEKPVFYKEVKKPVKMRKNRSIKSSNSSISLKCNDPLLQTWSGNTFMTDYENFIIDVEHEKNIHMAETGRKAWNIFKKKLRVQQVKRKTTNAGPEWFQDLSPYQMELTDKLHLMLHGDIEEGHSMRIQEYLFKVGIAPDIPPNIVAKTVQEAGRNPIAFLFKIHMRLVELETNEYEKKYQDAKRLRKPISPYSINERILLSCVFHLHFPKLLEKLDKILPPPEKEPKVMWAKKPPRKKIRYSSPYLEPLPINEKPWYEQKAEEELQKKVEAKMRKENEKREKEEFEKKLNEQKKQAELEKEEKLMKAKESLRLRASGHEKLKLFRKFKDEESSSAVDSSVENKGDKSFILSRERKSLYFSNLNNHAASSTIVGGASAGVGDDDSSSQTDEDEIGHKLDEELAYRNDPDLWVKMSVSNGCSQTPIRGIGKGCLYSPYVLDPEAPVEGVTKMMRLLLRKAPRELIIDGWTQTAFTKDFKPLKKNMRDFLLKQRAVEKQINKFYLTALHKRGIFGPPTDSICRTHCLKDLEDMAVEREIRFIKPPSIDMDVEMPSQDDLDVCITTHIQRVPRDISRKELITVKRLMIEDQAPSWSCSSPMKMTGPPLPRVGDASPPLIKEIQFKEPTADKVEPSNSEIPTNEEETNEQGGPYSNKPYTVECTDPQCELVRNEDLPMDEYELAKRRIASLPAKKQLTVAVEYLCDKGDPLAILPNIDQVPWLVRWFDKRRGVKRILTEQDQAELMQKSFDFWTADYQHCTSAPTVNVPDGNYTWENKKWLMEQLAKEEYKHKRAIKHVLIDNARDLFPSMFCEYYNTPLNKSFRQLFYTYFPACERDCLVTKPWNPDADRKEE